MNKTPPPDPLSPYLDALRTQYPSPDAIYGAARRRRRLRHTATALALAIVAAAGWLFDPAYRSEQFRTDIGDTGDWVLGDGSRLTLDTGSELRVEWRLRSRRLVLLDGEALFDVAPSAWRRFEVHAGDARIEDIGTVFSVRRESGELRVQVLEGAVRIHTPAGIQVQPADPVVADRADAPQAEPSLLVASGQRVDIASHGDTRQLPLSQHALAWSRGRLVFDAVPLAQAISEIQRYRADPIRISAPDVGDLRVSAQVELGNVETVLDALPSILPVQVVRNDDGSIDIIARQ